MGLKPLGAGISIVGAILAIIGSFGEWAAVGGFTINGLDDGKDGILTLILSIVTVIAAGASFGPRSLANVSRWLVMPFAALVLLIAIVDIADVSSLADDLPSGYTLDASVSWGLWLVLIGSIIAVAGGVLLMFVKFPQTAAPFYPIPPGAYPPAGAYGAPSAGPVPPQGYYYPPAAPVPPAAQYPPAAPQPPAPPAWPTTGPAYPGEGTPAPTNPTPPAAPAPPVDSAPVPDPAAAETSPESDPQSHQGPAAAGPPPPPPA